MLTSVLLMIILWQSMDPRGLVIFVLGLSVSEIFIVLRWRLTLPCPYCAFDPILYKKSPQLAAQKVRAFYEDSKETPAFYLKTNNPLLAIQKRQKKKNKQLMTNQQPRMEALGERNLG